MKTTIAILVGKLASFFCRFLNLGAGVTWAGELALRIEPKIFEKLLLKAKQFLGNKRITVVLVAGTNGKTTTSKLLSVVLKNDKKKVVLNASGANLLNGVVGSLLVEPAGEVYVLEVDENNLVMIAKKLESISIETVIIWLNLFRDQLDRYGEIDSIVDSWVQLANIENLKALIVNSDDPQLTYLSRKFDQSKVFYFGIGNERFFLREKPWETDSIFCPKCGGRLTYEGFYLSHLGEYRCEGCGFEHPDSYERLVNYSDCSFLEGRYNYYNFLAAKLTAKVLGVKNLNFMGFEPAFGRNEEINGIKILLSKNPSGFNASLRSVLDSENTTVVLLVLNNRIPDGRDISWIWDVDFEKLRGKKFRIYVSGDRAWDLALRLKYAGIEFDRVFVSELKTALKEIFGKRNDGKVWVLATYSGMLEVRKMLVGRKIL